MRGLRRTFVIAVVVLVGLGVGGCGGDDDDENPSTAAEAGSTITPSSGDLEPTVLFVKQSAILADADTRTEVGLVTTVDGIGDEAYATSDETPESRVAVRDGQQWFEVTLDTLTGEADEIDWAKQIATSIADSN